MRVVLLTVFLPNYRVVADWAGRAGHELVLVATLPAGSRAFELVQGVPGDVPVLITGALRTVAPPMIAAVAPDLLISAAYPRLIPPAVLALPAYGAVNLHPSALPAGRGPNPMRLVYEGVPTLGATLHRTAADFDTGAILSRRDRPIPDEVTAATVLGTWLDMFGELLDEGVTRLLAGDPGEPQDESAATYAGPFTPEEELLDLSEPVAVVRRKVAALTIVVPAARVRIGATTAVVTAATAVPGAGGAPPGTVLAEHGDGWTVQVADGAVRLVTAR